MDMKRCAAGHFFDVEKFAQCPYCTPGAQERAADGGASAPVVSGQPPCTPTMPEPGEGETVVIEDKLVVGWLVCVRGRNLGRDYRIHANNNRIGRDESMDIIIRGDQTVSRRNHAIISFDCRTRCFYFSYGEGEAIVRHNGKPLFNTAELNGYDHIEIGDNEFIFVPLCGDGFDWVWENKNE